VPNRKLANFDINAFFASARNARHIAKFRKNQVVFSQGDQADAVYYVQKGKVKITVISDRGKEAVVCMLGPDEFFGEGCIAGQLVRTSTVASLVDSLIVRIAKAEMIGLLRAQPALSEMFVDHILKRSIRIEEDLVDQLFNSSERRLARVLLLLANYGQEGKPVPIIAKISQETLAEMIGTTRSRVSHFMNKFRKLGLISYNGHIEVHQSLLNLILHDKPDIES
jgi:CRP-like cAMP-binding protein